ncbi:eukaryotic translation initiation factor 2A [Spodoptera litura]|uniref:Eukaryotic translation initiation factor 2A n=1 Tax=Spodoptera litura TaxID=69820 RepID=A0A9J7ED57_SPOLT|nr:eukaryotic translation initiation factor 2A [Spodoptera litura]
MSTPYIAGLTTKNIFLVDFKEPYAETNLRDETTTNIRGIIFSPKGTYLAYRTDKKVEIVRCSDWSVTATINGNVKDMFFSPLDNYFTIWEMFIMTKEIPQGKPNLHVYKSADGQLVGSFIQKNQTGWEPKWTSDEKLFAIHMNNRVLIYEDGILDRFVQQLQADKLKCFSVSPSAAPLYYFAAFTLGKAGQPSFWRVFKYPEFDQAQAVVSRSSFQADKATFYWNRRGTNVFAMTQTDVSIYTDIQIKINRVLLGGFGNIASGHIEVWELRGYKKVGSCAAPDTTSLVWDPRAETFVTATTYPRLTVGNGYKIWHYTCALMHKRMCAEKENLLAISWQPGNFPKSELSKIVPKSIEDATPKPVAAYRPPGAKNRPSTFTLHEQEKPHRPGETPSAAPSKQAIKQKEKREARKARKAEEKASGDTTAPPAAATTPRAPFISTGDPEKDKKIKNLNKKLSDIEKLKQQKAAGKQLELNQLAKIEQEAALLQELAQLRL